MGIDIIYTVHNLKEPSQGGFTLVLVHHKYKTMDMTFTTAAGLNAKLSGALGKEVFVQLYPS